MHDVSPPSAGADPIQVVHSAEQVALYLPIAGPGSRILAYAVDYLIIALLQIGLVVLLLLSTPLLDKILSLVQPLLDQMRDGNAEALERSGALLLIFALFLLLTVAVEVVYFIASEALLGGRSLGKVAVGLRVVGDDGFPLVPRASLVRNLLRIVDALPGSYVVGLIAMLVSTRHQRLGDLAAGTLVVRLDRAAPALPIVDSGDDTTVFRFSRAQLVALGSAEKALLRQTLRRIETLDQEQATAVLERSVEVLRARLGAEAVAAGDRERFLRALLRAVDGR